MQPARYDWGHEGLIGIHGAVTLYLPRSSPSRSSRSTHALKSGHALWIAASPISSAARFPWNTLL